ncbi:MAG: hypothetical protein ABI618_04350 [Nitrospirota bacterium]
MGITKQPVAPTPAGWPQGGTVFASRGPCVSLASWSALQSVRVPLCNQASRGVNGFGSFCRNKRTLSYGGETPALIKSPGSIIKHASLATFRSATNGSSSEVRRLPADPKEGRSSHLADLV